MSQAGNQERVNTEDITAEDQPSGGAASGNGAGGPIILFFMLGLAASLVLGWVVFPKLLYSQKTQPVDFNHHLHTAEVDNGCQSCHYIHADGTFSGIPSLADCMECHEGLLGTSDEELAFYENYVQTGREVPWLVYADQPDCVFFSHVAHVKMGNMDCVSCHGHIGESEHARVYEENRITGYSRDIYGKNIAGFKKNSWDRMKMNDCAACHRRYEVNQGSVQTLRGGCFVCHQ